MNFYANTKLYIAFEMAATLSRNEFSSRSPRCYLDSPLFYVLASALAQDDEWWRGCRTVSLSCLGLINAPRD